MNAVNIVTDNMGKMARDILTSKKTITKQDVINAKRDVKFNALSERAEDQAKVLKQAIERAFKSASLQENVSDIMSGKDSERAKSRKVAEKIASSIRENLKKEETMLAIASFLEIAQKDIRELFEGLKGLEALDIQDKFIILRNALYTIQAYAPTIDELYGVTTEEYMSDEGIQNQEFVVEDSVNALEDYETNGDPETVNTEGLSVGDIANRIVESSNDFELSEDETYYVNNKTGEKYIRVTEVITADEESERFDPNSPWATPASNIGTGVDEFVRDFIAGRITKVGDTFKVEGKDLHEVYPNATKEKLNAFAGQLGKFLSEASKKGITFIPRDVTVNGTITTIDNAGKAHTVNVAGTLDLLGYDADGNWYIYDMKTHRGIIDDAKKAKYEKQLTLYKKFLEDKFGITLLVRINQMSI